MKALLFLVVTLPLVLLVYSQFRETPEELLSVQEVLAKQLKDITFDTPNQIDILADEERVDRDVRQVVRTIILKTDTMYLPRSQPVKDKSDAVIGILKARMPDYDFGQPVGEEASYFRLLTPNSEWKMSSVETTNGFFSLWEKRSDVYQATNQ